MHAGAAVQPVSWTRYCCDFSWNGTACGTPTHGSYDPFTIENVYFVNNRTDASTSPNGTVADGVTTARVTATVTADASRKGGDGGNEMAVGLGVGLPLGVLLLAVSVFAWRLMKKQKTYEDPQKGLDEKSVVANGLTEQHAHAQTLHMKYGHAPAREVHGDSLGELDGTRSL